MLFIFSSIIFIKSFCILFTYSTVVHTYRHAHTYRPCFIHSEATNSRSINKRTCNHTIMCPNHTIATHVPSCIHIQLAIVFIQPCFVFFYSFSVWGSSMLGDKYFKIQSTPVFYSYTIYKKEKIFFLFSQYSSFGQPDLHRSLKQAKLTLLTPTFSCLSSGLVMALVILKCFPIVGQHCLLCIHCMSAFSILEILYS